MVMKGKLLILFVLTVFFRVGLMQQDEDEDVPRCLLSRLDTMTCLYRNENLRRAGINNQYSIHYTRMTSSDSGSIECIVRPKNQRTRPITITGSTNTKIIYSPGFIKNAPYDNQLLVQYNIDCGEDRLAFFNVTTIDMEGNDSCIYKGIPKCQDYILIDRGPGGRTELCGNTTSRNFVLELESRNFTVFFRTSEIVKRRGFEMYVICFRQSDRDLPGCLTPMDFNSTVCTGETASGSDNGDLLGDDSAMDRRKRNTADSPIFYKDIFPEYPPGLRMREDVAEFHNLWRRQKRQTGVGTTFTRKIVFFNESVNYTDRTIRIADTDGTETALYTGIEILQVLDAEGEITSYLREVDSQVYPHFLGPGPLIIIGRNAYFQLFLIDPRGLLPSPEEEEELLLLNEPLFDSVPESADFILDDPNPPFENFDFLLGRKRRFIEGAMHTAKIRRQATDGNVNFSIEALFVALRNREACVPALRTQAESLIQLFMETNETRVRELEIFEFSCSLSEKILRCSVDTSLYQPALDKGTYCTYNGDPKRRTECDPFHGEVDLTSQMDISIVTVEAINCNGQRGTVTVSV